MRYKQVRISEETDKRINELRRPGESYNKFIQRLMEAQK